MESADHADDILWGRQVRSFYIITLLRTLTPMDDLLRYSQNDEENVDRVFPVYLRDSLFPLRVGGVATAIFLSSTPALTRSNG